MSNAEYHPTVEMNNMKKHAKNGIRNSNDDTIEAEISEKAPCLGPNTEPTTCSRMDDETDKSINSKVENKSKNKKYDVNKPLKSSKSNSETRRFNFGLEFSPAKLGDHIQNKTGMKKAWILVCISLLLLLLVFFVISIVMSVLYWKSLMLFPMCRTTACLQSSIQILPKINFSTSPCDDVKNFACGSWLASKPLPSSKSVWNLKRVLQYQTREKIRGRIVTLSSLEQNSAFGKVKDLYEACMNLENLETEGARPLQKVMQIELGGWKVMRNIEIKTWDFEKTMKILHSKYRVSPFFEISLIPDPLDSSKHIIQILPAGLGLPGKVYYEHSDRVVSAYKQFMKDVTVLLGAISPDAQAFSEDMFGFEKRVAEVTPDTINEINPITKRTTVGEIKNIAPTVPLQDILIAKYPTGQIDDKTQLIVPHLEYLQRISNIISTTDRGALNNYLLWKFASEYVVYLSKEYQDTLKIYKKAVTGEEENTERWEMCVGVVEKFMSFGLSVLLENRSKNKEEKTKVVTEMFKNIKNAVKDSIQGRRWSGKDLQQHILEKVDKLSLQVGYLNAMTAPSYLTNFYSKLIVYKNDFLNNIFRAVQFLQDQDQTKLTSVTDDSSWIDLMSASIPAVSYYIPSNKVIVPHSLLVDPVFDPHYLPPVLYGGFGVELTAAILSAISPPGIIYSIDGSLLVKEHPAVNQSYTYVNETQGCLSRSLASNVQYPTLIAVSALEQSFKALKHELSQTSRMYQPALESYDSEALFFISYTQSVCSVKTAEQETLDRTLNTSVEDSQLLEVTLGQTEYFTKTFSCAADSRFNSPYRCDTLL